ncbi:barstar family protein [Tsukamurella serpentis]
MTALKQFLSGGAGAALTGADLDALKTGSAPRVFVVRGSRMRSKAALLDEISAALQFPLDFGDNWDALADSLGDLQWLGGPAHVVLAVAQAEQVLTDEPAALATFAAVLADRQVHLLLGAGAADAAVVRERWSKAGLTVTVLA